MNDHDLVLKHIETYWNIETHGDFGISFYAFEKYLAQGLSQHQTSPRNMPIQTIANSCCDDQPAATYGGIEDHPTL